MYETPLMKQLKNQKAINQQNAAVKRQEQNYIIEVKLQLCKKVPVDKARKYFDFIKVYNFPEFSHYWRALESVIDSGQEVTKENIQAVYDFINEF